MARTVPEISVVIATCSRADLLGQALASLVPQLVLMAQEGVATEMVIVDDGSTDATPGLLARLQHTTPFTVTILPGERRGVAAARNLAARHAHGTWMASFDDDQIALSGWLSSLYTTARESSAGAVGGALLLQLPPGYTVESLGPRTRGILGEHLPAQSPIPYPPGVRPATNNVLIPRDLFMKLGGYDTSFTEGAEDADFFDRLEAAGHSVLFQPAAQALHLIPASRLQPGNLRWTSLRIGAGDTRLYHRKSRYIAPMRLAAIRLAITVFRDLPQLLWSSIMKDSRRQLDVRCSLWYTEGFLRAMPAILRSRPESPFLRSLNFRTRNGERPPAA